MSLSSRHPTHAPLERAAQRWIRCTHISMQASDGWSSHYIHATDATNIQSEEERRRDRETERQTDTERQRETHTDGHRRTDGDREQQTEKKELLL